MSYAAKQWVFECSESRDEERLVLLVLASHAPDDNPEVFISWRQVAYYARIPDQQIEGVLHRLHRTGEIVEFLFDPAGDFLAVELALGSTSFAAPQPPSARTPGPIPAAIRAVVYARSSGTCEWPDCTSAAGHLHHRLPRARGGPHTVENLLHLCHAHHGYTHSSGGRGSALSLGVLIS